MPYKISGTKSETARVIIFKESDWTVESNTVVSGSGAYSVEDLETGSKTVVARSTEGEMFGYGGISSVEYVVPGSNRGVFGGGVSVTNVIDYITISTTGDAINFGDLTVARGYICATSNGVNDRGVFACQDTIDYITISTPGDATNFGDQFLTRYDLSATSNGTNDRGVFGGGRGGQGGNTEYNTIDYITISTPGNAVDFGDLLLQVTYLAACSNEVRGIFAGGYTNAAIYAIYYINIASLGNAVDFNGELTWTNPRWTLAGTSNGINDRGIFAGGFSSSNIIDYITISSTGNATDFGDLTVSAGKVTATSNGTNNRAVFGGGNRGNVIDYVNITSLSNAINFGDLTVGRERLAATSNS